MLASSPHRFLGEIREVDERDFVREKNVFDFKERGSKEEKTIIEEEASLDSFRILK